MSSLSKILRAMPFPSPKPGPFQVIFTTDLKTEQYQSLTYYSREVFPELFT